MKIFVAGATGALGRQLVPRLAANGHTVVGTTRTSGKAPALGAAGATPWSWTPWTGRPCSTPSAGPSPRCSSARVWTLAGGPTPLDWDRSRS